jgi:hypothetical protein
MNPLLYLKGVIGAVRAKHFSAYRRSACDFHSGVPGSVRTALPIVLVALLTGGAVYVTPNKEKT